MPVLLAALALMLTAPAWVQGTEYGGDKSMGEQLAGLAGKEPSLVRVRGW
jgi:hypothetical protein